MSNVWQCPEGAPPQHKRVFSGHLADVQRYLQGCYHVEVQARHEEDVRPEGIRRKVRDASGAKFGAQAGVTVNKSFGTQYPVYPVCDSVSV